MTGSENGWLEAAIAWEVCASLHRHYCKGKDALFTTRQSDFVTHAEDARDRASRGQAPAQPDLGTLNGLAKQYADSYASPHHFTLGVNGLRQIIQRALPQPAQQAPPAGSVLEDAARLDFIERHPEMSLRHRKGRWAFLGFTNYEYDLHQSLREAIDAAMTDAARAEQKEGEKP